MVIAQRKLKRETKHNLCLPAVVGVPTHPVDVCRGLCSGKIGWRLAIPHAYVLQLCMLASKRHVWLLKLCMLVGMCSGLTLHLQI